MSEERIKKAVREGYGKIARKESAAGCNIESCCCGGSINTDEIAKKTGYSEEELESVPEGANLGLGCGNPVALASLKEGETVLDLGSGAGFDCFLAAQKVGPRGKVIGVDMTPEMVFRARENAAKAGYDNVEFRLGELEHLPLADNSVEVVISNCVVNLAPDKDRVFAEVYRVLEPGGRFMISDMVNTISIPDFIRESLEAHLSCLSAQRDEYLEKIQAAGFAQVEVVEETPFPWELSAPTAEAIIERYGISQERVKEFANSVKGIKVRGVKPGTED